jgi:hypothetical protein
MAISDDSINLIHGKLRGLKLEKKRLNALIASLNAQELSLKAQKDALIATIAKLEADLAL